MLEYMFLSMIALSYQSGQSELPEARCPSGQISEEISERNDPNSGRIRADYPLDAQRAGREGIVVMRLKIGCDGRVKRCQVMESSGTQSLDRAACVSMFEYARFSPATDAQGQPIEEETEFSYTYKLS